jgi:hypothetical protein
VHAVFYQVGFILILHGEYNGNFILKNMGAAIIDFRVCPPLVKCQNIMFSGFIDTLMYGFSSTGVPIYCYFGLKFNDKYRKLLPQNVFVNVTTINNLLQEFTSLSITK